MGGSFTIETTKLYPSLNNDHKIADGIISAASKCIGSENVKEKITSMGAEDFAYYTLYKPSAIFTLGCQPRDMEKGIPLQNERMMVDEEALVVSPKVFIQFVLDNLNG